MRDYYICLLKSMTMRKKTEIFNVYAQTMEHLGNEGILLVAGDPPNPMTIGWGLMGILWGMPVFSVFVRPTRFTFQLMEKSETFSVCVMDKKYKKQVGFCGVKSGRETNKIRECGFTLEKGILIPVPYIVESSLHYECRIINKNKIEDQTLARPIISRYYPQSDFHTVYYGEILGAFKEEN